MPILSCPVPANISVLSPNSFTFSIQKYPEVDYFIQEAPLPGMQLGVAAQASSIHDLKIPGESLEFDDITLSFLVDEEMKNYLAIHDWMIGLGYPYGHKLFGALLADQRNAQSFTVASKTVSDCFLTIMNSDNKAVKRFQFVDAFPTALSGLTMQSTNSDVQYLVATVTLAYSYYTVS